MNWDAVLYLEKGHLFEGRGFGAETHNGGEAVFNTGLSGYQEIFTDPSYAHQVVVMTYPHIGNTGINSEDTESRGLFLHGVVAREVCKEPSSWRSEKSLTRYLAENNIPGISEIDTREVTQILRDEGAQRAVIFPKSAAGKESLETFAKKRIGETPDMEGLELVSRVSTKTPYEFAPSTAKHSSPNLVVYDFGVKTNILRSLSNRDFKVWVVPYNMPREEVMAFKPAAVVLSNGPGDPSQVSGATEEIQKLVGNVPILAICMGHQLLARALGGSTYKLKFGHHGVNHPVKDLESGKILITSQNHGFSVKLDACKDVQLSHVSLNDQTVEGFVSKKMKLCSQQFHPEAAPGPRDASYLFDAFIRGYIQ